MLELTPQQTAILERVVAQGFEPVAFPLYTNAVGVRKGNCAALLQPLPGDGFKLFGEASYLVQDNLSVRVQRGGENWFIWKKTQLEATAARLAELGQFTAELTALLQPII